MFTANTYQNRRADLSSTLKSGVILFLGNEDQGLNYEDNTFRFRQDSTFLYYFGISEPSLASVMDLDEGRTILFGNELSIDDIVWTGPLPTLQSKAEMVGVKQVLPLAQLQAYLLKAIHGGRTIHFLPPYRAEHKIKLMELLHLSFDQMKGSVDLIKAIVRQRNIKTPDEIEEIEKACDVTADMHLAVYRMLRPGLMEYEVASEIERVAKSQNCELSFATICTVNGQTLHNHGYRNRICEGDLLLIDAGAERPSGYCGDMSSTIPASKFSAVQKQVYRIQTEMHRASVAALRPGIPYMEVYERSAEVMVDGLKDLGLMKGDTKDAVREGAHAMFYPHGLGHMMGLDVHDMENLGEIWVGYDGQPKSTQFGRKSQRLAIPLRPGFVHTVEPGIYFIPELMDLWRSQNKFTDFINYERLEDFRHFGGIRNEEDYLITEDGARRLGKKVPLTIEEVEEIRK